MPKAASNTLVWSAQQTVYTACAETQQEPLLLHEHDPRWFPWLADRSSFSFQGKHGRLNLLKETRKRGREGYWYAYARHGKRIVKRYAGRTSDLTILSLEMLAQTLATDTPSKTTIQPPALPLPPVLASQ